MLACAASVPARAATECKFGRMVELPVIVNDLRPTLSAKINDVDVRLLVDSGAIYSMLTSASAAELRLKTFLAPFGLYLVGVGGGTVTPQVTKVATFTLAGVPLHNIEFLVGGSEMGGGLAGLLGQNILHIADVEYDLGQGVIRLWKPVDCKKAFLGYWVKPGMDYSVIDMDYEEAQSQRQALASASINGSSIRVLFDTGAGVSVLSAKAAARVGVKASSAGVQYGGTSWGAGKTTFETYIAPFASFKLGAEEVRNTRLRIAELDLTDADMLIGPDFFLSHRVLISNSQHKIYFTYTGGPVFKLDSIKSSRAASAATPAAAAQGSEATGSSGTSSAEDAADASRRGQMLASRHQYPDALAALNHACELDPDNAEYRYQRAEVRLAMNQGEPALADLDQALKLKPDHIAALVARAELSADHDKMEGAAADLDQASTAATPQADVRFSLGRLYVRTDRLADAIAQFDLWTSAHPDDARLPEALNLRCWARGLAGRELPLALKDCDAAMRRTTKGTAFFAHVADSRGLVYLRLGAYDKSISDYDASLKIASKNAWAWYGRGLDELRKHALSAGRADIEQATALSPKVAEYFSRRGMSP